MPLSVIFRNLHMYICTYTCTGMLFNLFVFHSIQILSKDYIDILYNAYEMYTLLNDKNIITLLEGKLNNRL